MQMRYTLYTVLLAIALQACAADEPETDWQPNAVEIMLMEAKMAQDLANGIEGEEVPFEGGKPFVPRRKGNKIIIGLVCWELSSFHPPSLIFYIRIGRLDTGDRMLECLNGGYTLREHTERPDVNKAIYAEPAK